MENFSFQYPTWLVILVLLAAAIYAVALYYRTKKFDGKQNFVKPLLSTLRFLSIFLIGLLLLGPLFKIINEESKKPTIAVLQDNSLSVGNWLGDNDQQAYNDGIGLLKSRIAEKFQVDSYTFSNSIQSNNLDSLKYGAPLTNIADPLKYIYDIYEGDHLGAVILASDGIYNEGKNPSYISLPRHIPIYSVAIGDTSKKKDLILKRVFHSEIAYLNDKIITPVDIQANNSAGESYRLTLEKRRGNQFEKVTSQDFIISGDSYFETVDINLELNDIGVNHYRYRLSGLNDETNRSNNVKDIFIDVLDGRQNISIIANAPHPDISALVQVLEKNKNYEVSTHFEVPNTATLQESNMVIFHNLPSGKTSITAVLNALEERKIPRLFIVGNQTDVAAFNKVQSLVNINGQSGNSNEAQGRMKSNFNLFSVSDQLKNLVSRFPPLFAPFGEYTVAPNAGTLMQQSIGSIETDFPLISFADNDGIKTGLILGEGIWRWKLFDYLEHENSDLIGELINKSIIYISTKEDKRKFRVNAGSNVFLENEAIVFQAELYNNSYELVIEPDVFMTLTNENGENFDFTFSKQAKSYTLNIGSFPKGTYRYVANTSFNGEPHQVNGRFTIKEAQFELYNLEADHSLMVTLSGMTNGKVYFPNQLQSLTDQILSDERLKPVLYQNAQTTPFIDHKLLMGLIGLLLALEWFLRRYHGSL